MSKKILIIGAAGQIGTSLTKTLRKQHGNDNVIATDIRHPKEGPLLHGPFEELNVMDKDRLEGLLREHEIDEIYHLAAMLSATAEKNPLQGWDLNMKGLLNALELGREGLFEKIFWPSSIAVFGPSSPKIDTPQHTVQEPTTVYGISKVAGESWCSYYHKKFGVDVRSIRYPGLISYDSEPGGGTTDYAVHIFHKALEEKHYTCFLSKDSGLPMMYMDDAIRATLEIMEAPAESIQERTSYNISGVSFTPEELAKAIQKQIPDFTIEYEPDYRDDIASGWPSIIDDSVAREHWGWKPKFDIDKLVSTMLENLRTPAE